MSVSPRLPSLIGSIATMGEDIPSGCWNVIQQGLSWLGDDRKMALSESRIVPSPET